MKALSLRERRKAMKDNEIIELYFSRDEKAIKETAKSYGKYCHAVANNILGNPSDAEECVNDTYLRAWNAIPPERPRELKLFLAKITRNLALNRYFAAKSEKRGGGEMTVALSEVEDFISDGASLDEGICAKELAAHLRRFLLTQSSRDRAIFVCRYFYFESVPDIAAAKGISENNVYLILSRMREKLKKYLQNEGYTI